MSEIMLLFKVSGFITAIVVGGLFAFSVANDSVDNFFDVMGIKSGGVSGQSLALQVHDAINEHRQNKGLQPLQFDSKLASIAQQHSENMAEQNIMAHVLNGKDHGDRFRANGYDCKVWVSQYQYDLGGENVFAYRGAISANEIVSSWLESPSHRENIEERYWENSGVGIAKNSESTFVTQNFC